MDGALTSETSLALMQASQSGTQGQIKSLNAAKNAERVKETAREFEAVFLSEMLKPMFEGVEVNETFGGGKGEEIFRSMMIDEYGKNIAEKNITGIQTQVMNKLIDLQAQRTAALTTPTPSTNAPVMNLDIIEE